MILSVVKPAAGRPTRAFNQLQSFPACVVDSERVRSVEHATLRTVLDGYRDADVPLLIRGATGVGKSRLVREDAERYAAARDRTFVAWNEVPRERKRAVADAPDGYHIFVDVRLAQVDPTDLRGLPDLDGSATTWHPPLWVDALSAPGAGGTVFLDELNLAPRAVQNAAYQVVLDRQVGEHALADDVWVVAAGNRQGDEANVRRLPAPLRNRFGQVELRAPTGGRDGTWTEWAVANNLDPRVVSFVGSPVGASHVHGFEQGKEAFATPRSWERVSTLIEGVSDPDRIERLTAPVVGSGPATEFAGFLRSRESIDAVVEDPRAIRSLESRSARIATMTGLAEAYAREDLPLDTVTRAAYHLDDGGETEVGILGLKRAKRLREDHFRAHVTDAERYDRLAEEIVEYLL